MLGLGLSLNKNTFIGPYILNQITNSVGAYSLRKLKSTATNAIRVRRSSDDAELDIPFCGSSLCVNTLTSFVGAGSGFITTWYDQSGNGNHITQATAGTQPVIISTGTLYKDLKNNPTIRFNSQRLTNTSITWNLGATFAFYGIASYLTGVGTFRRIGALIKSAVTADSNNNNSAQILATQGTNTILGSTLNGTTLTSGGADITLDTFFQFSNVHTSNSANDWKLYRNGTNIATNTVTANITANEIMIGCGWNSSAYASSLNPAYVSEIIIMPTANGSDRVKLEQNQLRYYKII
jgi:hypothetical protein